MDRNRLGRAVASAALVAICAASGTNGVQAAIYVVDSLADGVDLIAGDGLCKTALATCTLRAAIQQAAAPGGDPSDTIQLPVGTIELSIAGTREDLGASGDLDVTSNVTIEGQGATVSAIDANQLDRVLQIHGTAVVTLRDLSVRGARLLAANEQFGGGIFHQGESLLMERVIIENNQGDVGAGIFASRMLTMRDCIVRYNEAPLAGVVNPSGVGLHCNVRDCVVETSTFLGNLGASTIEVATGKHVVLTNSTVSGNEGGISAQNGDLNIVNSTITDGIFLFSFDGSNDVEIWNSIVRDDGGNGCEVGMAPPVDSIGNVYGLGCIWAGVSDTLTADARLAPLADNGGPTPTHLLLAGSPAIDSAAEVLCPDADQRGVERSLDGNGDGTPACDAGSVEIAPEPGPNLLTLAACTSLALMRRRERHANEARS